MEIETLKKDYRKYWIAGSVVILMLISTIFFVSTHANYRVTEKVNIANGIINWSPSDLSVMAIKISDDGINYFNSDTVPISGYILNTSKSACRLNGTKLNDVTIEYNNGYLKLDKLNKKGTKCEFYFDPKLISIPDVLAGLTEGTRANYYTTLTENTTGKIYTTEDNDGTSYYYAGAVDNNWVKFGGFYWRIIRINGDGTIRLIYNGPTTDQIATSTQIGIAKFPHKDATNSAYSNDNAYVGYMYGTIGSSTYELTHANINSSYVKQVIDEWYNTNLNKVGIREHIDINAGFCGDRSSASGTGAGTSGTNYGAYNRLNSNKVPSLKCTNANDLYTISSSNKGNKALTYPVGLISADEVVYAGGKNGSANSSYYLNTGQTYWTMSPYLFYGNNASVFYVGSSGNLDGSIVDGSYGARPVINLKADTVFKAGSDGTTTNPYEVI